MAWGTGTPTRLSAGRSRATPPALEGSALTAGDGKNRRFGACDHDSRGDFLLRWWECGCRVVRVFAAGGGMAASGRQERFRGRVLPRPGGRVRYPGVHDRGGGRHTLD